MSELELSNFSARSEEYSILKELDLKVKTGEIHAVLALSSKNLSALEDVFKGKATHLSGEFRINRRITDFKALSSHVSVIGREPNVFPELSITENILLSHVKGFRTNKRKEQEKCRELTNSFGMEIDLSASVKTLTDEERLLIHLLRAYLSEKRWIVLYDTLIDLGVSKQQIFVSILNKMKEEGKGILYLTARPEDAVRIGDRISIMRKRKIVIECSKDEFLNQPDEFMAILTGWNEMGNLNDVHGNMDLLKNLVAARGQMLSDRELQKELSVLAQDMMKVIKGDRCVICMTDQSIRSVISTYDSEPSGNIATWQKENAANDEIVCSIIDKEQFVVVGRKTPYYGALFDYHDEMNSLLCMPIKRGNNKGALLMVFFEDDHEVNETDQLYMDTFVREIAIATETSELIGKSTLLQESHHRIKNNLQMIVSLVYMQKRLVQKNQADVGETFDSIIRQISSIAKIHDLLSNDSAAGSIMNLADIIEELVKFYERPDVKITLDLESISIPYNKAATYAIVINEILTNCLKHAYKGEEEKEKKIDIFARNDGMNITIRVADNGRGFPEESEKKQDGRKGIGSFLIDNIVKTSGGTLEQKNEGGAVTIITVPVSRVYEARNSAV